MGVVGLGAEAERVMGRYTCMMGRSPAIILSFEDVLGLSGYGDCLVWGVCVAVGLGGGGGLGGNGGDADDGDGGDGGDGSDGDGDDGSGGDGDDGKVEEEIGEEIRPCHLPFYMYALRK